MEKIHVVYILLAFVGIVLLFCLYKLAKRAPKNKLVAKCGHETLREGKVKAFGETITTKMPVHEDGSVDYCLECLGKMAICCAWCRGPIFVGDPVTLYFAECKGASYVLHKNAVMYDDKRKIVVGCGRTTCADTGADYAGTWVPGENGRGKVHRRPSMIEQSLQDIKNGGKGVIVQNH